MSALSLKERIEQKRKTVAEHKQSGLRPYKWRAGKTLFRILPDTNGGDFWRDFGMHYVKSRDGQQFVAIGDRELTYGESDPVREMLLQAIKSAPDETQKKFYKEMLARRRCLFNALILDDPNQPKDEPVLVEMSESALDDLLAHFQIYMDLDESHDLASADRGHIFICEKTGSGLDTEYKFNVTPKPAPIKQAILDKRHDLDGWISSTFTDKETKALQLLRSVTGNTVAGSAAELLTGGTKTPPAAITHVADDALDADLDALVASVEADSKPKPAEAEDVPFDVVDDDEDAALAAAEAAVAAAKAKKAAAAAEKAAAAKAATPTPATTPAAGGDELDIDSILAGLD